MLKRLMWGASIVILMLLLLSSGCARETEPVDVPDDEPSVPVEVVIAQGPDIAGWDIHDHNITATEAVHVNVLDYLVWRTDDMVIEPALATSWEVIEDTVWRFHLREGVTWHDGEPFTAADVKFTLERIANPETGEGLREHGQYHQIKEVRIIDDHTIEIITHDPEPVLLHRLCRLGSGMLPKHFFDRYDTLDEAFDAYENDPIGTGPYRVVEWIKDDRVILEAYANHWRGRPSIDRIVHRAIPEDSTRVAELITGGIHIADMVPAAEWPRVEAEDGVSIKHELSQRVVYLIVRHQEGYATHDPRIREAIDYAIDNAALVDELLGGAAIPARTRVTPGNFGADPDLYDTYLYDPDHARALLADAGYGPDSPCEIGFLGMSGRLPMDREVGQALVGMLEDVGFSVDMNILEWAAYREITAAREHPDIYLGSGSNSLWDAYLAFWGLRFSWDTRLPAYPEGTVGWTNHEFDQLVLAASTEMNPERRYDMYVEAGRMLAEGRPHIYLYQLKNAYGVADNLDWRPRVDQMFWMHGASFR